MAILQGARITGSIIATQFIKASGFSGSLTASNLYVLGKAGIGTTSPTAKLEIAGFSTGAGLKLNYGNSSGTIEAVNFIANGGANGVIGMQMVSAGVGDLWLGGSGGRTLTLYRDGNVGIGTTSPSNTKLHIVGDWVSGHSTVKSQTITSFSSGGTAGYGTYDSDGTRWGYLYSYSTGTSVGSSNDSPLILETNGTEKVRITSGGNVGIGTSSPGRKLHLYGPQSVIKLSNTGTGAWSGFEWSVGNGSYTAYSGLLDDTGRYFIDIGSNGDDFTILQNGNVGIGTTSPLAKLSVGNGSLSDSNLPVQISTAAASGTAYFGANKNGAYGALFGFDNAGFAGVVVRNVVSSGASGDAISFVVNNTTTAVYIKSDGNVGIGTTSPAQKLHIVGAVYGTTYGQFGTAVASGTNASYGVFGSNSAIVGVKLVLDSDPNRNDLVVAGTSGNIGIGTSSPTQKLHVAGDALIASSATAGNLYFGATDLYIRRDNSYDLSLVQAGDSNSGLYLVSAGSVYLNIDSNNNDTDKAFIVQNNALKAGTELFRVQENGNVGIGTTSPGYKLDVNGSFRTAINNLTIFNDYIYVSPQNQNTLNSAYNTNGVADMWINFRGYNDGQTQFRNFNIGDGKGANIAWFDGTNKRMSINNGQAASYTLDVNGTSGFRDTMAFGPSIGLISWGSMGGGTGFGVRGESGRALSLGSNGSWDYLVINTSGNVGIGTTSPSALLHVRGASFKYEDTTNSSAIQIGPMANNYPYVRFDSYISDNSGYFWGFGQKTAAGATRVNAFFYDNNRGWYSADQLAVVTFTANEYNSSYTTFSEPIKLRANGATYFNGGNVGIGTTSPSSKLDVNGTSNFAANVYHSIGGQKFFAGSGGTYAYIYTGTTALNFINGNDTSTLMTLLNGGNVGIGTTSPAFALDVTGGVGLNTSGTGVSVTIGANNTSDRYLRIRNSNGNFEIGSAGNQHYLYGIGASNYFSIYTNVTERMRITADGVVLIGTTSAYNSSRLLQVKDGLLIGNSLYTFASIDTNSSADLILSSNANPANLGANSNIIFKLGTSGGGGPTERMRIVSDGNVGIGTTSPGAKLDVDGNIYVRSGSGLYSNLIGPYTGDLTFYASGSEQMRISGGNIGIGTTSPTCKLYVSGSSSSAIGTFEGGSGDWSVTIPGTTTGTIHLDPGSSLNHYGNAITFGASDSGSGANAQAGIYIISDDTYGTKMYFATTDAYVSGAKMRMMIDHVGNVGIGTTSPTTKLEVVGDIAAFVNGADTITRGVYIANAANTRAFNFQLNSGGTNLDLWSYNSAGAWARRVSFNYDGNVGIGTTAPSSTLYVSGNVGISGNITKGGGSFLIEHPDPAKQGWKLQHSFVESPTVGDNIYRYEITINETLQGAIELPNYWKHLNENPQIWINPVNHFGIAYGEINEDISRLTVFANSVGKYNILLIGTRKDPTIKKIMADFAVERKPE